MLECINKKNETLVSVIMPAYNTEKYIEYAISSVLSQSYPNFELIVIDDGSKDNTVAIIKKFIDMDARIKLVINQTNLGVSATRNKGISIAKGEWIAFLDSDDIWKESKLEKQIQQAEQTGAQFLFTGVSFINENNNLYKGLFEVPSKVTYNQLLRQNVITCSSVLIKKHFFETIKMEKDEMHEDYAVWLRILNMNILAYGINEPLLIYRISRNSKSGKKLNTIMMTYKVFRFVGIKPVKSFYFMVSHVLRSLMKYKNIKRN